MEIKWKKNRIIMMTLGFALFIGAAVYFLVIPLVVDIRAASNRMQEKIIDQEIEKSRLEKLPVIEEDWSNFEAKKEFINVILNPENEVEFIENIESIAEKTGNVITLKIESNLDQREIEKLKRASGEVKKSEKGVMDKISYNSFFPAQINIKGDYSGLINFINMLENSQIYVNIISIQTKKVLIKGLNSDNNISSVSLIKEDEGDAKEMLDSVINAIVYVKK